jgi:beta-lactamase regulating signal transducer with metallopeptidase domain
MIAAALDHLWQSTLFAAVICLIVPLFRANSAAMRFWLWFAASVKFLVPLSLFTFAGHQLLASVTPMPALVSALQPVAIPFSAGKPVLAVSMPHLMLTEFAVAAWALGGALVLALWILYWARLRAVLRDASDLPFAAAVPVKAARSCLEPGLVGIWRPVILLPEGISEKLSPLEMEAVMTHELCHLRRRDNLLAAVHMLVEMLFWFHPLVWWLGGRLAEEREQACDEQVLAAGNPPLVYAQGILKVCRFYVQSPLPCASGVTGATLEMRVGAILRNRAVLEVEDGKKALLVFLSAASVMLPLLAGSLGSPPVSSLARRVVTEIAAQAERVPMTVMPPDTQPIPKKSSVIRLRRHAISAPALQPDVDTDRIETALPVVQAPAAEAATAAAPENADVNAGMDESAAIVCRPPQSLPGSRFSGPPICLSKAEWSQIRAQGKDVGADGRVVVADGEKYRSLHPQYCTPAIATGATAGNVMGVRSICF